MQATLRCLLPGFAVSIWSHQAIDHIGMFTYSLQGSTFLIMHFQSSGGSVVLTQGRGALKCLPSAATASGEVNDGKEIAKGTKAGSTGRNRRGSDRVLPLPLANRLPVVGAPLTPIPEVPEGNQGEPAG